MDATQIKTSPSKRPLLSSTTSIIVLGVVNFTLFLFTIVALFVFFWDTRILPTGVLEHQALPWPAALLIDLSLMTWFNVGHSLLLESKWKVRVAKFVPMGVVPVIYSLHACLSLLLLMYFWQPFGGEIYHLQSTSPIYYFWSILYVSSWLFIGYAMISIGAFRQTGMEQWWRHLKGRSQKFEIPYGGAFKICRHPIYFAFLGMIWFGHSMSLDHVILGIYWSAYIFYGATMKEKHMKRNQIYKLYMERVPPFPLWPKRPLKETFSTIWGYRAFAMWALLFISPNLGLSEIIQGKRTYNTWNEATHADSSIQFYIESVKMGFLTSKEKGQVMEFSYSGDYDQNKKVWKNMNVTFPVLKMNTNHSDRDEKLHNVVIDHRVGPELKVEVDGPVSMGDGEHKVAATLHILGKKHPFELTMETQENERELIVKGSATLSLGQLIKLGLKDPSIAVAKLSDGIELKFNIGHKR